MKTSASLILLGLVLLSGCNAAITDFVKGTRPVNFEQPSLAVDSPMAIKVSPGHVRAVSTGAPGAMEVSVTATNRTFSAGTDMSAQLTLSRTRVKTE